MSIPLTLPDPTDMASRLTRILPRFAQINWVQQTTSTNTDLVEQARDPQGQILRPWLRGAHYQSQGQGRGGKPWDNTPGIQLMFSCAFDVFLPSRQLPTLSPAMGVAACQALRGLLPDWHAEHLSLKWPNDLMWGHRSEEHTSELQSRGHLVCRLLLEKKKKTGSTWCSEGHIAKGIGDKGGRSAREARSGACGGDEEEGDGGARRTPAAMSIMVRAVRQ